MSDRHEHIRAGSGLVTPGCVDRGYVLGETTRLRVAYGSVYGRATCPCEEDRTVRRLALPSTIVVAAVVAAGLASRRRFALSR